MSELDVALAQLEARMREQLLHKCSLTTVHIVTLLDEKASGQILQ